MTETGKVEGILAIIMVIISLPIFLFLGMGVLGGHGELILSFLFILCIFLGSIIFAIFSFKNKSWAKSWARIFFIVLILFLLGYVLYELVLT